MVCTMFQNVRRVEVQEVWIMDMLENMTAPEKFLAKTLKKRGRSDEEIKDAILMSRKFSQKDTERINRLIAEKMIIKSEPS